MRKNFSFQDFFLLKSQKFSNLQPLQVTLYTTLDLTSCKKQTLIDGKHFFNSLVLEIVFFGVPEVCPNFASSGCDGFLHLIIKFFHNLLVNNLQTV